MEFNRQLKTQIASRLNEKEPLIQVILGPRQVGKTTSLRQALAGRGIYCTADSPVPYDHTFIDNHWSLALQNPDKILARCSLPH